MTTGIMPIRASEVRYGDVFRWHGSPRGPVLMFVAWAADILDNEGPNWLGFEIASPRTEIAARRGFSARGDGDLLWERLP